MGDKQHMSADLDALLAESENDTDLVKNLRKALRDSNKALKEVQAELDKRAKTDRTRALADVLKAKGAPEKAAKYFPADVEPTEENVQKWLEEDGDLFGIQAPPSVPEETVSSAQRIAQASAQAPQGQTPLDLQGAMAKIRNTQNEDELAAVFEQLGMKPIPDM